MNKVTLGLFLVILGASMVSTHFLAEDEHTFQQFLTFMKEHNKKYATPEEFQERFEIFKQNYQRVEAHQKMLTANSEDATFEMGITQFFDLTPQEFEKTYLNLDISLYQKLRSKHAKALAPTYKNGTAPESWDWREQNAVTPVKSQGSCGSCWAFSAIGNIESVYAIKTGKQVDFSEQQLVDCDKVDQGCNGGLMEDAYKYLQGSGVMTESDYSYTGTGGRCKFDANKVAATVSGYHYAGTEDENQIKQLLFENGPFAIAINATPLQFYFFGIFNPWFEFICNPKGLNHGVLLVGYGVSGNKPYWIVKNSWGSSWGEKGYFRIIAGKGACGINQYVITAEVAVNEN